MENMFFVIAKEIILQHSRLREKNQVPSYQVDKSFYVHAAVSNMPSFTMHTKKHGILY